VSTLRVEVHTGNKRGAGTRATVQARLVGSKGESSMQTLQPKGIAFRRNTVETFEVEGVTPESLGEIVSLEVGHDGTCVESGWLLDRCVVRTKSTDPTVPDDLVYFPCGAWLGTPPVESGESGEYPLSVQLDAAAPPEVVETASVQPGEHPVMLRMVSHSIPAPGKQRGEDASFQCSGDEVCAMGVADGVGEWARDGIDSGVLARGFMAGAEQCAASLEDASSCLELIQAGLHLAATKNYLGSATVCLVALDRTRRVLYSSNLGDSGYMIIRDEEVIYHSPQQEHFFGCPFQLRVGGKDRPTDAQQTSHIVEPGDFIIAATDGLFDNLHDYEMTTAVSRFIAQREQKDRPFQDLAEELVDLAFEASVTRGRDTPYSRAASQEFDMFYQGGKKDDITAVVAEVVEI